jgi:hypothetical protein
MKTYLIIAAILTAVITISGCFPGTSTYSPFDKAGFFSGIWHGWIAPLSLIVGIFDHDVRIYEPFNTGWWYDFGFYIAVIAGFGGIQLSRRRKKKVKPAEF